MVVGVVVVVVVVVAGCAAAACASRIATAAKRPGLAKVVTSTTYRSAVCNAITYATQPNDVRA